MKKGRQASRDSDALDSSDRACIFFYRMWQGDTRTRACRVAGISWSTCYAYEKKVKNMQSLRHLPIPGRPPRYTDQLLDWATDELVADVTTLHTPSSFTNRLIAIGVLQAPVKVQAFISAWRSRLAEKGYKLVTGSTGTKFFIASSDLPLRVQYANDMLRLLKETNLMDWIFVDETTLEECPHPKSGEFNGK